MHIHRSNRTERLLGALGDLLAEPRGTVFAPERIAVQGRGMAAWLSMELSKRFGVWAQPLDYPRELVRRIVEHALGPDALDDAAVDETVLQWAIVDLLPSLLDQPAFAGLRGYVDAGERDVRIVQLAGSIATVFDQYVTYRPDWIRGWERGESDRVPEEHGWQPILWRALTERLGTRHVAALEPDLLARLGRSDPLPGLPPRISVFGIAALPPLYVRVLAATSRHADVHLFLFSPSVRSPARDRAAHPLVRSFGSLGADLDRALGDALEATGLTAAETDHDEAPGRAHLLARLQADIHDPPAALSPAGGIDASSIAVHACHGPMREVEVLHDQLLALTTRREDPVAPEDIVVLVPDLETYAPLVEAVFSAEPFRDERFLPFHVADRASRRQSPVIDALFRLLAMARGRVTAAEVVDLLMLEAVQRRFGFDAVAVDKMTGWVVESGIRWGRDAEHRRRSGVPPWDANTWRFGLRRMLLGYAMPTRERTELAGVLAYDEIEGRDAMLLGRLARFCRTLFSWLDRLDEPRPLGQWVAVLGDLAAEMFSDDPTSVRDLAAVRRAVEQLAEAAELAGFTGPIGVASLGRLVERGVDAGTPARGFLAGGITFCGMVPMRTLPFRVVALLGMNDDAFPRSPRASELDLLRAEHTGRRAGDRAPREDDRWLFLETLCAARDRLIVTYTGRSIRDNRVRPPSVCVEELLDHLERDLGIARDRIVVEHRLQPFDATYFDQSDPRLFSYSKPHAAAARVVAREGEPSRGLHIVRKDDPPPPEVTLDELERFFKSPPSYFLAQRMGIYLREDDPEVPAREPLELDALEEWKIGDSIVRDRLAGVPAEVTCARLRGRGDLPLGFPGTEAFRTIAEKCETIVALAHEHLRDGTPIAALAVDLPTSCGVRVVGTIEPRWSTAVVACQFSLVKPKYELRTWVRHVVMCAAGGSVASVLVGRGNKPTAVRFSPIPQEDARALLDDLVDLWLDGRACALPFLPEMSKAYASALAADDPEEEALARARHAYGDERGETQFDPSAAYVFEDLEPPFVADYAEGDPIAQSRFHLAATRVFRPLLHWRTT